MMTSAKRLFVVLVGIFNETHEKIALIKRNNKPYQGLWSLVGGKIKDGEDLISAAKREVLEETGVELTNIQFHGVLEEFLYYERSAKLDVFHIFVVSGETNERAFNCSEEGIVKWFHLNTLDDVSIIPSDKLMITKMILNSSNTLKFAKAVLQDVGNDVTLLEFKVITEYQK